MVDIFRAPDQVGPVVADAVRLGARTALDAAWAWSTAEAAEVARAAGLAVVVMDRCPMIEWRRLGLAKLRPAT